jgi:hypothetical protein
MISKALLGTTLSLLALASAQAAAPTATLTIKGASFQQYSGTDPIGVETKNTLYWIDEGLINGGEQHSWFLFFDPVGSGTMKGTITFAGAIQSVLTTQAELEASAPHYYTGNKTKYPAAIGLEKADASRTSFAGNTLNINWAASNPGDHVRVFTNAVTAVPEPSTYALLLAGLGAVGLVAHRRKQAD